MTKSTRPTTFRTRALSAALLTLGCSLGVSLTPAMLAAGDPPSPTTQALPATGIKHNAKQGEAIIQADKDAVEADEMAISKFEMGLTPATAKLPANQKKLAALKATLKADQQKLHADQARFDDPPKKK